MRGEVSSECSEFSELSESSESTTIALQLEYSPRKDSSLLTPLYSLTKSELIKNESELVENKSELRLTGRDARLVRPNP